MSEGIKVYTHLKKQGIDTYVPVLDAIRLYVVGEAELQVYQNRVNTMPYDQYSESLLIDIIRGIQKLREQTPGGRYYKLKEQIDEAEKEVFELFKAHQRMFYNQPVYQDAFCIWIRITTFGFKHKDETIKRSLRSLRAKGWVKTSEPATYLLPEEALQ